LILQASQSFLIVISLAWPTAWPTNREDRIHTNSCLLLQGRNCFCVDVERHFCRGVTKSFLDYFDVFACR